MQFVLIEIIGWEVLWNLKEIFPIKLNRNFRA